MDILEVINTRYSVRAYKPDKVEDSLLQAVLEAARLAPTAANRQPFSIIVLSTTGRETELRRIYGRDWFVKAPLILCACSNPSQGWSRMDGKSYVDVDVAIAMDHLILTAASLGLGTCWIADFDPAAAREVLNLPPGTEPVVFTQLGYPDDQPRTKDRKGLSELVRYDHW